MRKSNLYQVVISSLILVQLNLYGTSDKFSKKMNYLTNYQQAIDTSVKKYKPVLVVISTVACPWCKKFENQTLKKTKINDFIQLHFTPVKLLKDKSIYPKKILDAQVVPTIFFVDPHKNKPFYISRGYMNQKEFLKQLHKAKSIYYNEKE